MRAGSPSRSFDRAFLLLLAGALAGCGGKSDGAKDSVYGKVTLNGQPVTGQVVLIGSDNKEISSLIAADGEYRIVNPPKGEARVLVKGRSGAAPTTRGVTKGPEMPGMSGRSAAPPSKYATAAGGLKFTVTGGDQKYDITLTP